MAGCLNMLRFAVIAAVGALSAAGAAKAINTVRPNTEEAAASAPRLRELPSGTAYAMKASTGAAGAASVVKGPDGHFWAEGLVNGKRVRFLVDTGASAVALTLADAQRLGVADDLDYSVEVSTANGKGRAAPVMLQSVSVAGAKVADVRAFVIEEGLDQSLLGMTYLGRLSRFEATPRSLILRP
jgi:aspartyl protease family protein